MDTNNMLTSMAEAYTLSPRCRTLPPTPQADKGFNVLGLNL